MCSAVADLRTKWAYMGRYTLLEAHRKVFLYPENWAEPSLRDNKSEQFQVLEATVLQNDVSTESIINALQTHILLQDSVGVIQRVMALPPSVEPSCIY